MMHGLQRLAFQPQKLQRPPVLLLLVISRPFSTSPPACLARRRSEPRGELEEGSEDGTRRTTGKPDAEADLDVAREWLQERDTAKGIAKIPHSIGTVTFSRSSGPGGQNVNKVASKATLRVPLHKLGPHIPKVFLEALKQKGSRYLTDDGDIVISSDSSRSQLSNTKDCWGKLYDAVVQSASVPGKTTPEQKEHVKNLTRIANEKRLDSKSKASKKKSDRRGPVGEW
ncbi:hypothetical protein TWF730_006833 [Orbilia blumenaviensis]|uniref:Prokaryotic-type class I peptide chain release factors domain-containing protein n=1 Tax=Orbilia blumenaviensis TaxID=1796055 RepID=A0AAV9VI00_9PEZI